jgi:secondary thiamine-phosphate synthase enzyme
MPHLSAISRSAAELIATATLTVETPGEGFVEITAAAAAFVRAAGGDDGVLLAYIRHTSASLVIRRPRRTDRSAHRAADPGPRDAGWVHNTEGPDDMPSHVRTMLTGVCVHVPVTKGALALGTWQGGERRERESGRRGWHPGSGGRTDGSGGWGWSVGLRRDGRFQNIAATPQIPRSLAIGAPQCGRQFRQSCAQTSDPGKSP